VTAINSGAHAAPFTVRVAGRRNAAGNPIVHNAALGESFPIRVPADTLLQYDPTYSEGVRVIIEGPLPGNGANTLEFRACAAPTCGGTVFGPSAGIDGSGLAPYGFELRNGDRNLVLEAAGAGRRMDVTIKGVDFTGAPAGSSNPTNDVDVYVYNGATGSPLFQNCRFSTDATLTTAPPDATGPTQSPPPASLFPALVFALADQTSAPPPTVVLSLRLVGCTVTVGTSLPEVSHGIRTNFVGNPSVSVTVDGLTLDDLSNTDPAAPQGITEGILFATDVTNGSFTVKGGVCQWF
jgi:hypothetical protein